MSRSWVLSIVTLLVVGGCGWESQGFDGETVEATIPAVPAMVVLDASGSMKADDAPGVRFVAAQQAVTSLIAALPDGHQIGLDVYGTSTGSSDAAQAKGCKDIKTVVPFGKLDKASFTAQVAALKASGYTPIGAALAKAADELPKSGKQAIVLVSDGIDTCSPPDPCQVARDLHEKRPGLAIHTVAFRVADDPAAREQLSCIARTTGGLDLDASSGPLLRTRLLAVFDPARAANSLQPGAYRELELGMSISQARQAAPKLGKISAKGRVEVVYVDCTVIFQDGVLVEIVSSSKKTKTVDGIGIGDDISSAEKLYGTPGDPLPVSDKGYVTYPADPVRGIGYRIKFKQDGKQVKGPITRIIVCRCSTQAITYDPAIEVRSVSDVDQLVGTSDAFRKFIARTWQENDDRARKFVEGDPYSDPECAHAEVRVTNYRSDGYASGSINDCGGYSAFWSSNGGAWHEAFGLQSPPNCTVLLDARWPQGLWFDECFDDNGVAIKYGAPDSPGFLVSPGAIGPFTVGDQARDLQAAGLISASVYDQCGFKWERTDKAGSVFLEFRDGKGADDLDQISFGQDEEGRWLNYRTVEGLGIGTTVAQLKAHYGSRLAYHHWVEEGGESDGYTVFGPLGALTFGLGNTYEGRHASGDDRVMAVRVTAGTDNASWQQPSSGC